MPNSTLLYNTYGKGNSHLINLSVGQALCSSLGAVLFVTNYLSSVLLTILHRLVFRLPTLSCSQVYRKQVATLR